MGQIWVAVAKGRKAERRHLCSSTPEVVVHAWTLHRLRRQSSSVAPPESGCSWLMHSQSSQPKGRKIREEEMGQPREKSVIRWSQPSGPRPPPLSAVAWLPGVPGEIDWQQPVPWLPHSPSARSAAPCQPESFGLT